MINQNVMRRFLFFCMFSTIYFIPSTWAQSQVVNEMSNAVTELTGSFMDNPNHHSNTIKLYDLTQQLKKITDELYSEALYSNHPQANSDLPYLRNMKGILKCLDFIVANIAGYSRGGVDAAEWENFFHYILPGFGWTYKVIHSTDDVVFYEYSKDNFKMVLAKNIRPKKDGGDYNANSFSCYTWIPTFKEHHAFTSRVVFGGNYQFVEYGDDETKYKKISKVSSKRGTDF